MRSFLRTSVCRFVSAVTAFTMLFSTAFSGVHAAYAAETPPPQTASPTVDKPKDAPTIVRELTEKRSANVTQYLLSDGTMRAEITQVPTRFKKNGKWVDIDTSLVPADEFGGTKTACTSSTVSFKAPRAVGAPVTLSGDGYEVGLDMLDATEGPRLTIDDTSHYLDVAPAVDLEYKATRDGVKETVVLKDRSAASTFRFKMDLDGLALQRDPLGRYTLVRPDGSPTFEVGALVVFDSSVNAAGDPAHCPEAKMTVAPTVDGGAIFTYEVPRGWIDDPARVFPIKVDPTFTFTGKDPTADAYVSSKTGYDGNGSELKCGYYDSTTGYNRSYVKFLWTTADIPAKSYVSSADLQLWLNHQYYSNTATSVRYGKLAENWGSAVPTTWSNKPGYTFHGTESVSGRNKAVHHEIGDVMQEWVNDYSTNFGMQVYQLEDGTQNTTHWKRFWSSDYTGGASYLPKLIVNYSNPFLGASTIDKTVYRTGDIVTARIHVRCAIPEDINCIQATVRGMSDGTTQTMGTMQWTESQPGVEWGDQLTDIPGTGGGWVSSKDLSGITFLPSGSVESVPNDSSSDDATLTLVWRVDEDYGNVQDNDIDVVIKMDPSDGNETGNRWTSAVKTFDCNYDVLPSDVVREAMSTTTANSAWFVESDTTGDGKADNRNDSFASGRGSVSLAWAEVDEADSYNVYLFDGNAYRQIGASNTTTWTTAGAGVYPNDTQISQITSAGANPFRSPGTGFDLRDDPTPLYAKTLGTTVDNIPAYFFKIVPVWGGTEGFVSEAATVTVQLADRTLSASEAPAYTTYDLGSVAGDGARLQLNNGAVKLSATDLAIDSYGPAAALTRTYNSLTTTPTYFGDGWRFNFEASVSGSGATGTRVYTDGAGEQYLFTYSGTSNVWQAPHSMVATLTWTASNTYELVFKGGDKQVFDSTGRLTSEKDRHNSSVDYIWNGTSSVTIRAANSHSIVVSLSGGAVTQAAYQAGSDTRLVTYTGRTQVAKRLSSTDTLTVLYAYDAAHHLQTVSVPGFAPGGIAALWRLYVSGAGALTEIEYPNGTSSASRETSFTLDAANRTAHVYRMARVGTGTVDSRIDQLFTWDPTGRQTSVANPTVEAVQPDGVATTDYSPYGAPRQSQTASEVLTLDLADARGNVLISEDGSGDRTLSTYSANDDLVSSTDPRLALTLYEYNASGDLTRERRTLNDTESSETSRTYDGFGRLLAESQLLNAAGEKAVTEYTYASFTTPETTVKRGVKLGWSEAPVDLTSTNSLDAFGQVIAATDDAGVQGESTVYDLSGRVVSTTDASGTVTHHAYDVLSAEVETSRTAGTDWADFTRSTIDPTGLVLQQDAYVLSGGVPVLSSTTTYVYDASGSELSKTISDEGSTRTAYDTKGNVTYSWDVRAADKTNVDYATRTEYTADSQVQHEEMPGVEAGPGVADTTYNDEGLVAKSDAVDAGVSEYFYDENGNLVSTTLPSDDEGEVTETSEVDLGGRVTETGGSALDASATTTYDLADRLVSSGIVIPGGTDRVSSTDYNTLGWPLRTIDADGVTTYHTYDRVGREVSAQVVKGAQSYTVTHEFDGMGRSLRTVNADGTVIETGYDAFGRQSLLVERPSVGSQSKSHDVSLTYDARGRLLEVFDAVPQMRTNTDYATTLSGWTNITRTLPGSTMHLVLSPNGLEESRTLSVQAGGTGGSITSVGELSDCRNYAGVQQLWQLTTSSGASSTRLDLRDSAGRISDYMVYGLQGQVTFDPDSGRKDYERFTAGDLPSQTNTYSYTGAGRLASATIDGVSTQYEYDGAGQITKAGAMTLGYGASHLETTTISGVTTTYTYDDLGRRLSQVSGTSSAYFGWDAHSDRLLNYTHKSGSTTDVVAAFTYDSSGQRTGSVVTSGGVTTENRYVYEGLSLLSMESTRAGEATRFDFMYDETGKLMGLLVSADSPRVTYQLPVRVTDRDDVVSLKGAVSYSYDAYGQPIERLLSSSHIPSDVVQKIADLQPLRYAGYAYDEFSGLYYCSQRYYDAATMQFISADPTRADGEESGYQYCGGEPVDRVDPTGMWSKRVHRKVSFRRALSLHFSTEQAMSIAIGSGWVDIGFEGVVPYHGQPGYKTITNGFLKEAVRLWRQHKRGMAMFKLGESLHPTQDRSAHYGRPSKYRHLHGNPSNGYVEMDSWKLADGDAKRQTIADTDDILRRFRRQVFPPTAPHYAER